MIINQINTYLTKWYPPALKGEIPYGDMPGDKTNIIDVHFKSTEVLFPKLLEEIKKIATTQEKIVIGISGGSGSGKTGVAALLAFYLNEAKIGCYNLSGDNYPRRVPIYNDAERYRYFEEKAFSYLRQKGITDRNQTDLVKGILNHTSLEYATLQENYPWLPDMIAAGKSGLYEYLGTPHEINFDELSNIIAMFKHGNETLYLKRMGRTLGEVWYDAIDFSHKQVLIIEWTHANNDYLKGVDIPILLQSTPEETKVARLSRNRDQNTDTVLIDSVIEVEQRLLHTQAHKAKIILSRAGDIIDYETYLLLMSTGGMNDNI